MEARRSLAAILFTDIVDSTRRRELRRHGGREANTAGDGFMAVFDRPDPGLAPRVAEVRQRLAGLGMAPRG